MTKAKPKRKVTVRIAHSWEEAERLDREWWDRYPPEKRMEMAWDLVVDYFAMRGEHGVPRLQRSVCSVKPLGS